MFLMCLHFVIEKRGFYWIFLVFVMVPSPVLWTLLSEVFGVGSFCVCE